MKSAQRKSRTKVIAVVAAISLVVLLSVPFFHHFTVPLKIETNQGGICIERDGILTPREGMGAMLQHCKDTLILALALSAEVHIQHLSNSTHGYNMADLGFFRQTPCPEIFSPRLQIADDGLREQKVRDAPEDPRPLSQNRCRVSQQQLESLLPTICSGNLGKAQLIEILGLKDCATVYHTVNEDHIWENYNDCVAPWYYDAVRRSPAWPTVDAKEDECVRIGIHLRWGDTATRNAKLGVDTRLNIRSISIRDVNKAYKNIHFIGCPCQKIKVYVKNNPGFEPGSFVFNEYEVVDSGDDMYDLIDYARNDILIQGGSTFPVLASFSTLGKKVITSVLHEGHGHTKYEQRFSIVNKLFSPPDLVVHVCNE